MSRSRTRSFVTLITVAIRATVAYFGTERWQRWRQRRDIVSYGWDFVLGENYRNMFTALNQLRRHALAAAPVPQDVFQPDQEKYLAEIRLEKEPEGRVRWFGQHAPDEEQRLLAACAKFRNRELIRIVTVALETGCGAGSCSA